MTSGVTQPQVVSGRVEFGHRHLRALQPLGAEQVLGPRQWQDGRDPNGSFHAHRA